MPDTKIYSSVADGADRLFMDESIAICALAVCLAVCLAFNFMQYHTRNRDIRDNMKAMLHFQKAIEGLVTALSVLNARLGHDDDFVVQKKDE